jgi:molybdopterin-biosynthesis enzyme MoeA-like protein
MSQLVFVTGGLGPTSDDFTRDVIADWCEKPLLFDEASWQRIVDRLSRFNVTVASSNRQQCFFPLGATILPNPEGTASGFTISLGSPTQQMWVLPGPPREVSAIWAQGIEASIRTLCPHLQPQKLLTWQCIGKSEAELGEITEIALQGSGLLTGYRAHRPFVEVKVWCPENLLAEKKIWFEKLEEAISPWIVTRQGEDLAARLLRHFYRNEAIEILDSATAGLLAQRLGDLLRRPEFQAQAENLALATEWANTSTPENWVANALEHADESSLTLAIAGFTSDGRAAIGLREEKKIYQDSIQSPYTSPELMDRTRYLTLELALKKWCDWLDHSTH